MACITRLCSTCLQQVNSKPVASTIIPKRFRYYWEARPQCRERARLMMITLPKLQARKQDDYKMKKQEDKLYGLDIILHREVQEIFSTHEMCAVCLYADQIDDSYYYVRYDLQQNEMNMERYDQHILEFSLKGTQYEHLLTLFDGPTTLVYGKPNASQMLKAIKKNKQLLLIGGVIDGKLMSVEDIEKYATLQSLEHSRSELCGILSMASSSTYHLLSKPASALSQSLNQYANENEISVDDKDINIPDSKQ